MTTSNYDDNDTGRGVVIHGRLLARFIDPTLNPLLADGASSCPAIGARFNNDGNKPIHAEIVDPSDLLPLPQRNIGPKRWLSHLRQQTMEQQQQQKTTITTTAETAPLNSAEFIRKLKMLTDQSSSSLSPGTVSLELHIWTQQQQNIQNSNNNVDDDNEPLILTLNRDPDELVSQTVKRIENNLNRKLGTKLSKKRNSKSKNYVAGDGNQEQPIQPTGRILRIDTDTWQIIPDDVIDDKGEGDNNDNAVQQQQKQQATAVGDTRKSSAALLSSLTNAQLWTLARTTPLVLELPWPPSSSSSSAEQPPLPPFRLLIESCPPTLLAVRAFEDFTAKVFVNVPIFISTQLIHYHRTTTITTSENENNNYDQSSSSSSSENKTKEEVEQDGCRVDWYVNGSLRLSNSVTYIPTEEHDLDQIISVVLTPYRLSSSSVSSCLEEAYSFTHPVDCLPENTLLRLRQEWLEKNKRQQQQQNEQRQQRKHEGAKNVDSDDDGDSDMLRIVTYNILADQNAFQSNQMPFYPYVPKEILSKHRRFPLIVHELLAYEADIICLQEVDEAVYYNLLHPVLCGDSGSGSDSVTATDDDAACGADSKKLYHTQYDGYYACKSNDGTREGLALFWRRDKFQPMSSGENDSNYYELSNLVSKFIIRKDDNSSGVHDDYDDDDKILQELLLRYPDLSETLTDRLGHVVQIIPLLHKKSKQCIWAINTHLFFHPLASHVRLIQTYAIAKQFVQLQKEKQKQNKNQQQQQQENHGDAVVFCGDLNSSLQNAAGKLLMDRFVPTNFRDLKTHLNQYYWGHKTAQATINANKDRQEETIDDDNFPALSMPKSFPPLQSALVGQDAPRFSHYISDFSAVLDHVLVSSEAIRTPDSKEESGCALMPLDSAPMPTVDHIPNYMPSENLPSDHVSLVCDVRIERK